MKGHAKTYAALALLLALVGFLGGCIAGLFLHAPSDLARAALALAGLAMLVLAFGVVALVYTTLDDGVLSDEELEALNAEDDYDERDLNTDWYTRSLDGDYSRKVTSDDTPDDGSLGRTML